MPDIRDQLQRALGETVVLERELAGGGMSRVFVARDTSLDRRVVVKVLAPELAAGISAERFEREIRTIASLQQANIVPLLSAGRADDLPYYTMPFVEGLSLRQRLARDGALSIREATDTLRDVARALAYAHERGVVHRDIKPDNVLLSGGAAVVTDFGIAKAISTARTGTTPESLTQTGTAIGTPAYMAPEQMLGDRDTDHRADVYAFGCLAYELISGHPPFHGFAPVRLAAAHIQETPRSLVDVRSDTPAAIAALVARCLEKEPARRPQTASELLDGLDARSPGPFLRDDGTGALDTTVPSHARGAPGTIARHGPGNAGATRRRKLVSRSGLLAILMIAAVGAYVSLSRPRAGSAGQVASLAVLPFLNVGGDSTREYLADGMSDALATTMGRVAGVQVKSRTGAFRYKGRRDIDVREAGRELGAQYLLQGTLRQTAKQLRVSAQLNRAADGVELWSDAFDVDAQDPFVAQNAIVNAVAARLAPRASGTAATRARATEQHGTTNAEAYDLFQQGEYLLKRRGAGVRSSADLFEQAIAKDNAFAPAYAELSVALALFPFFTAAPPAQVRDRVTAAAQRAIALDATLGPPHTALAMVHTYFGEWQPADDEFRRATTLQPDDAEAHIQYGRFLSMRGNSTEALAELERAKELDPLSSVVSGWRARFLIANGRTDEALVESQRTFRLDSTSLFALYNGAVVNAAADSPSVALRLAKKMPLSFMPFGGLRAQMLGRAGDRVAARRAVQFIEDIRPRPWFGETAIMLGELGIGDTTRALDAMTRAGKAGEPWFEFDIGDPMFDPVRKSARFIALVRGVGLDDRVLAQRAPARRR